MQLLSVNILFLTTEMLRQLSLKGNPEIAIKNIISLLRTIKKAISHIPKRIRSDPYSPDYKYYDLHPTQASRGLARVKTERMAGRQQVRGVPKTAC